MKILRMPEKLPDFQTGSEELNKEPHKRIAGRRIVDSPNTANQWQDHDGEHPFLPQTDSVRDPRLSTRSYRHQLASCVIRPTAYKTWTFLLFHVTVMPNELLFRLELGHQYLLSRQSNQTRITDNPSRL